MPSKCLHLFGPPFIPLQTSEWPFDKRFCYFPKKYFFLGHTVLLANPNLFHGFGGLQYISCNGIGRFFVSSNTLKCQNCSVQIWYSIPREINDIESFPFVRLHQYDSSFTLVLPIIFQKYWVLKLFLLETNGKLLYLLAVGASYNNLSYLDILMSFVVIVVHNL